MSVSNLKRCAKRSRQNAVILRTKMQQPDGSYRTVREDVLVDDPKNGVYDLTKWKRKYAAFEGRYAKRTDRPDNYSPAEEPLSDAHLKKQLEAKYGHLMVAEKVMEADAVYDNLLHTVLIPFVADRIYAGGLSAEFQMEALEAAKDAMRRAVFLYDPTHPPKGRNGADPAKLPSASLETYLATCARNAIIDFAKWTNGDKVGGWLIKLPISNAGKEDAACGEISAEAIPSEAKYSIGMIELCIDCAAIRELIERIHGKTHLEVFDKLLMEFADSQIYQSLGVTWRVFRTRYLRPIQDLVHCYWLEPNIPRSKWK